MLKSEMQHQYWVTKKTVQRKFGSKEDECIVSSDAELDAKIELFKSINESFIQLHRVIDNYQERICILAQEENALGKFLKETGKGSATSGKTMSTTGKSLSYCGAQRMTLRAPLLRLLQEVDTFRGRAVIDTHMTIQAMERERTEYRAALSWMKSTSAQLDPDTGKGLDKFRKAQQHVRASKVKFDRFTLDCLQKIDLLAAARCNMFSHALVAYQSSLMDFFTKTSETFRTTITTLDKEPHYSFTILKELTQSDGHIPLTEEPKQPNVDSDQMLFFKDDYKDEKPTECSDKKNKEINPKKGGNSSELIDITGSVDYYAELMQPTMELLNDLSMPTIDKDTEMLSTQNASNINNNLDRSSAASDLLGLGDNDFGDFISASVLPYMPSQLLLNDLTDLNVDSDSGTTISLSQIQNPIQPTTSSSSSSTVTTEQKQKNSILDLFQRNSTMKANKSDLLESSSKQMQGSNSTLPNKPNMEKNNRKSKSKWFDELFSDLDPLANPDSMEKRLSGNNSNSQAA